MARSKTAIPVPFPTPSGALLPYTPRGHNNVAATCCDFSGVALLTLVRVAVALARPVSCPMCHPRHFCRTRFAPLGLGFFAAVLEDLRPLPNFLVWTFLNVYLKPFSTLFASS